MKPTPCAITAPIIACFCAVPAGAMQITGYSSGANDRFASGYPIAPVESIDPAFVGFGLDWAGVGWAAGVTTKSFAFISPSQYLVAKHYGGAPNIRIFANGTVKIFAQSGVEHTGYEFVPPDQSVGDLSLGTLASPVPAGSGLPRFAVLDLNISSTANSPSAYNGLDVLLYGRGPNSSSSTRVGAASINGLTVSGVNHHFTTNRNDVQLEGGDSGSPALHRWPNPAGMEEITLLGNHSAITSISNIINTTGSATDTGMLRVASGAVLAGDGRIVGDAAISGSLAPGNSIGTLTVDGNVTWNAGNPWSFELGTAAVDQIAAGLGLSSQDMLAVTNGGFFPGTGSQWIFDFMDIGELGWFRLATWSGSTASQMGTSSQ